LARPRFSAKLPRQERQRFFQSLNKSFKTLKADSDAWKEELEERHLWDQASLDNLNDASSAPSTNR